MPKIDKNERKMIFCLICGNYYCLILLIAQIHSKLPSTQGRLCDVLYKPQPKKVEARKLNKLNQE